MIVSPHYHPIHQYINEINECKQAIKLQHWQYRTNQQN